MLKLSNNNDIELTGGYPIEFYVANGKKHEPEIPTTPVDPWSLPELQITGPKWNGNFFSFHFIK